MASKRQDTAVQCADDRSSTGIVSLCMSLRDVCNWTWEAKHGVVEKPLSHASNAPNTEHTPCARSSHTKAVASNNTCYDVGENENKIKRSVDSLNLCWQ